MYNWAGLSRPCYEGRARDPDIRPFSVSVDLQKELSIQGLEIVQVDAQTIDRSGSLLPDMQVYHHFANNFLLDFDFALFCHDDIVLNENIALFDEMLILANRPLCAFIAEPHVECLETLSVRVYPHFIFIKTSTFFELKLSFINEYQIFAQGLRCRPPSNDGGAGLLAACYNIPPKGDFSEPRPHIPNKRWFRHLRMYNDSGIESHNIHQPNSPMFLELIKEAQRYVDARTY